MGYGSLLHVLGSAAVRFAIPLLVALTAVALVVGCGDGDDEAAAPVPLAQLFVTAEDAPGTKPDPVETRRTTMDFDEFIASLSDGLIEELEERPDPELDDERRRYYRLTNLGHRIAVAEAERLERLVKNARAKKLLSARGA